MSSVNKATILGNLGRDPEIRFMPGGEAVANLSIATSETWKDKNSGEKKEATEWHRVVFFGKVAELCQKYLAKGSKVYIEGMIKTRKWDDDKGVTRYSTEIMGREIKFLSPTSESEGRPQASSSTPPASSSSFNDVADDIPF